MHAVKLCSHPLASQPVTMYYHLRLYSIQIKLSCTRHAGYLPAIKDADVGCPQHEHLHRAWLLHLTKASCVSTEGMH